MNNIIRNLFKAYWIGIHICAFILIFIQLMKGVPFDVKVTSLADMLSTATVLVMPWIPVLYVQNYVFWFGFLAIDEYDMVQNEPSKMKGAVDK